MRIVPPPPKGGRPVKVECLFSQCSNITSGNKPYCADHVLEMPYARVVAKTADTVSLEAAGLTPLSPSSPIVEEVRQCMSLSLTGARICKDLCIKPTALRQACSILSLKRPPWTKRRPKWPTQSRQ